MSGKLAIYGWVLSIYQVFRTYHSPLSAVIGPFHLNGSPEPDIALPMDVSFANVPWNTPATWREANASLSAIIQSHASALADLHNMARRTRQHLESLFPLMDNLCRETCPDCTNVCCTHAWVWADFRDLLFYHLTDVTPPDYQLLESTAGHCRFASPHGCRLERIRRPFVCTWYLCPVQTHLLFEQPTDKHRLAFVLHRIKEQRRQMEDAFIQAMA
jgi:hypothetical protein